MKTIENYCEAVISCRAKNVGLRLEKGYQKYMHPGWGYVTDEDGYRIEGYQLFDRRRGVYLLDSYNDIHTHCITDLETVAEMIVKFASNTKIKE